MNKPQRVTIYTDGACRGNPGPGGWAAILIYNEKVRELSGNDRHTTNNRMELTAVIKALEALKRKVSVDIYSDSSYVVKGMSEWLPGWKRRGWKRSGGELENVELWQELDSLASQHNIAWHWVKGHHTNTWNNRADELATAAINHVHTKS